MFKRHRLVRLVRQNVGDGGDRLLQVFVEPPIMLIILLSRCGLGIVTVDGALLVWTDLIWNPRFQARFYSCHWLIHHDQTSGPRNTSHTYLERRVRTEDPLLIAAKENIRRKCVSNMDFPSMRALLGISRGGCGVADPIQLDRAYSCVWTAGVIIIGHYLQAGSWSLRFKSYSRRAWIRRTEISVRVPSSERKAQRIAGGISLLSIDCPGRDIPVVIPASLPGLVLVYQSSGRYSRA